MKTKTLFFVLFFLSGAASLIYQVVWVRMLVLVFGTSVFAVSTVLGAFMAGLALGSFYYGRVVDSKGEGLRLYGLLELGIAAFALLFPILLAGLDDIYTLLYQYLGGTSFGFSLIRFLLSFVVLLIPTTLMGATLPVLSKYVVGHLQELGKGVGWLYAVNTFGAAIGALVAAFVLLEYLGVTGTTYLAIGLNLLIAGIALWWNSRATEGSGAGVVVGDREEGTYASQVIEPSYFVWMVLGAFGLSGFVALGYEVLWTRLLSMLLKSATAQSLSTILVCFLGGLAAGGAVGGRYVDQLKDPLLSFGIIQVLIGLCGLVSISAFGAIPYLVQIFSSFSSWGAYLLKLFLAAFGIMLLPTFLLGLLFPVVSKLWVRRLETLGSRIGDIYGINTLGAVLGALGVGFVLLPLLGTQASIQALAWINLLVGIGLVLAHPALGGKKKAGILSVLAVPVIVALTLLPKGLFVELFQWTEPNSRLLFFDEGTGGTVTVHEYRDGNRLLKINGGGEVPTDYASLQTFRFLGNLPMLLHPKPQEVAVIAFGGGITLAAVELHGPEQLDCIEVVEGVFAAGKHFSQYNYYIFNRFDRPYLNAIIDDGRNHMLRTAQRYDVIISDATHPGTADSWVLYTEEFYRLCQQRLEQGGIMAQWLPVHGLSREDFRMILRTFRAVFPHASLWLTREYAIMLATPQRLHIDLAHLQERLQNEMVQANLEEVDLGDPVSFMSTLALGEQEYARFVGTGPINTDDRPYISFTDRRRRGTGSGVPIMIDLSDHLAASALPYLAAVDSAETSARLERRFAARRHTVQGLIALLQWDDRSAEAAFRRAVEIDPAERGAARALQRR